MADSNVILTKEDVKQAVYEALKEADLGNKTTKPASPANDGNLTKDDVRDAVYDAVKTIVTEVKASDSRSFPKPISPSRNEDYIPTKPTPGEEYLKKLRQQKINKIVNVRTTYVKESPKIPRERNPFIGIWLFLILGLGGYFAISEYILPIANYGFEAVFGIAGSDNVVVLIQVIKAFVPIFIILGAILLLAWKRSGLGFLITATILYVASLLFGALHWEASIGGLLGSFGFWKIVILSISLPISTYGFLHIHRNGHSCWSLMD